ncbi:MAG TPA: hypothetical protein VFN26_01070 [Candidatus Acidoferrum sp.]|nr:hypothetical protein [Candidatus Acidoferrum sp.]
MSINPLARKLGLRPGMQALIVAAPPGYWKRIAPLPDGLRVSQVANGMHPFIQFFATRASEIKKSAPKLLKHAAPGALVWIAYPKKTSGVDTDLSREAARDVMSDTGWQAVSIVAIDEVWSALRFRPTKDVKSR